MNYQKIYNSLIERSKLRELDCYVERHHIVPRCMGGSDDKSNLVRLTPEEHYVAHQLLVKIHPDNADLVYATMLMAAGKRSSNRLYGWLRKKYSEALSDTEWINDKNSLSKRVKRGKPLPEGWVYGRLTHDSKEQAQLKTEQRENAVSFYSIYETQGFRAVIAAGYAGTRSQFMRHIKQLPNWKAKRDKAVTDLKQKRKEHSALYEVYKTGGFAAVKACGYQHSRDYFIGVVRALPEYDPKLHVASYSNRSRDC